MSLSARTMKTTYNANGTLTTFALPDVPIVDDSAEVKVYTRDDSVYPATITLQTEGALNDYTLTGAPDNDSFHVNVEFNTAPTSGLKVIVALVQAFTQALDYNGNNSAGVRPTVLEQQLDVVTGLCQQLEEQLTRVPKMHIAEQQTEAALTLPAPNTGTVGVVGWGTDGTLAIFTIGELELLAASAPLLNDLTDVNAGSPTDEQVLTWDAGTSRWIASDVSTAAAYATETIAAAAEVTTVTNRISQYRPVVGDAAPVSASTVPFGTTGGWDNGTQILLRGTSDTNTVTFAHNDAAKGMILNGNAVLGNNDMLIVIYDSTADRWIEVSRNF